MDKRYIPAELAEIAEQLPIDIGSSLAKSAEFEADLEKNSPSDDETDARRSWALQLLDKGAMPHDERLKAEEFLTRDRKNVPLDVRETPIALAAEDIRLDVQRKIKGVTTLAQIGKLQALPGVAEHLSGIEGVKERLEALEDAFGSVLINLLLEAIDVSDREEKTAAQRTGGKPTEQAWQEAFDILSRKYLQ
jgi:hypothetical protein